MRAATATTPGTSSLRALFVFLDGVGLGDRTEANPFTSADLPALEALLEGRRFFRDDAPFTGQEASLVGLDAGAGHPGIPQSGTGHASLLTGEDAVTRFGRHYGPWVPTALRPLVVERSLLALAKEAGRAVAFANAYPEELIDRVPSDVPLADAVRSRRLGPLRAGPPLAALGAGALTRHTPALERSEAVASEIVNEGWIRRLRRTSLPEVTPEDAGRNLARIAAAHDLTLFAHYSTDYVGHRGTPGQAVGALERVDAFLAGLLAALPTDVLLLIASDHGNIEDTEREHTRNPALGVVVGPGHREVSASIARLWDVPRALLRAIGVARPAEGGTLETSSPG